MLYETLCVSMSCFSPSPSLMSCPLCGKNTSFLPAVTLLLKDPEFIPKVCQHSVFSYMILPNPDNGMCDHYAVSFPPDFHHLSDVKLAHLIESITREDAPEKPQWNSVPELGTLKCCQCQWHAKFFKGVGVLN